jgi:hypothetical protein
MKWIAMCLSVSHVSRIHVQEPGLSNVKQILKLEPACLNFFSAGQRKGE